MSTIKFEAAPLPAHAQPNSDAPRKKRKRAPAQGAADDCFTCSGRNLKCDRRRPYCSQCLDGGQDCAGYKTQLTWGVGVASRGKLRGLSLPVAGTSKTLNESSNPPSKPKKRNVGGPQKQETATPSPRSKPPVPSIPQNTSYDAAKVNITVSHAPYPSNTSRSDTYTSEQHGLQPTTAQVFSHNLKTTTSPPLNLYSPIHAVPAVCTSISQGADFAPAYDNGHFTQPSPYMTPSPTAQYFHSYSSQQRLPPTPNSYTYSYPSEPLDFSHAGYQQIPEVPYTNQHDYVNQTVYDPQTSICELMLSEGTRSVNEDDVEEINRDLTNGNTVSDAVSVSSSSSSWPMDSGFSFPLSGVSMVGKNARMQYLIQYYAEVIAPVIVAFDSPTNPLRNQILGLAARSESLQHAISALSASNIRQRQESGALSTGKTPGARRSSYMHLSLTNEAWDDSQAMTLQDRKREESLHKYAAVRSLNKQLANPAVRNDDAVLATLLMLCLFHICDSGIARFQTQFAGVKKLLNLRGHNYDGPNGNTKWMTRVFALFDSVAATVNDREVQIDGQYVEISAQADGEWPFETLTGVDSRLFRSMSRLGRLNILSQGKSVGATPAVISKPLPTNPFVNNPYTDFGAFDGNGWMRIVSDEDLFNMKTASPTVQEQFWREWREVRQDLQTWCFDNTRFDGSDHSQPYLTPEQRYDMGHVSESFRYSALLYTERLADPRAPSSDTKIQDWVQKSLYHIKQVRADVYLLWPLFITGSECGDEQERNVIRERCLDIQKDSGFMNNSSCLTLLEKVWAGGGSPDSGTSGQTKKASNFRFRDVMLAEGNEGEWIVV